MLDFFLVRFSEDPWWFGGSAVLTVLIILLLLISFFRNARTLFWFYCAALLLAAVYGLAVQWYPLFLEALVSYRSDWSLVFLIQNLSVSSAISQFILYLILYSFLAIVLVVVLELWALLTFRWARLRIILERSFSESWFVLVTTLVSMLMGWVWFWVFGKISFVVLGHIFMLNAFIFLLQLFLRLVDNAFLHSPKLLVEYLYVSGLFCLLALYLGDWFSFAVDEQAIAKVFFLNQLYVFFLGVLLMGYLSAFFVRALFASEYYLEHAARRTTLLSSWTSRFLLSARDRNHASQRILSGILLVFVLGYVFLLLALQQWFLTLVPAFFLAYFVLFYLLDRQDDMRVRGDLVDKRIESAVSRVFFG